MFSVWIFALSDSGERTSRFRVLFGLPPSEPNPLLYCGRSGQSHFDFIVREYVEYYHEERPHQGIGNVLLTRRGEPENEDVDDEVPTLSMADIRCTTRLGGNLKSYTRAA